MYTHTLIPTQTQHGEPEMTHSFLLPNSPGPTHTQTQNEIELMTYTHTLTHPLPFTYPQRTNPVAQNDTHKLN